MGVVEYGKETYLVKFDDSASDKLFAMQGDSGRAFEFILTDLSHQAINLDDITAKFTLFVKRFNLVGTVTAKRNDKGNYVVILPQGFLLDYDTTAEYMIFIVDDRNRMLSQKVGKFEISRNPAFDSGDGVNLLFDYEEIKKTVAKLGEYEENSLANLELMMKALEEAQASAKESTESKNISVKIKNDLLDIFDSEEARKQAHANRTTTWNSWWDIVENVKTGWKITFSKWTDTFNTWTNKVNEWFNKFASFETAEKTRVENENTRKSSEDNRVLNFKNWSLKVQDFITNDANHQHNETERITKMNEIISEWNILKKQLPEIDAGNLQLQINDVIKDVKGYVKSGTVNTITNSIELFLGSDVDEPTFKLQLPKGFSGSWNDLSDKPAIYTQTEANNKFVAKIVNKGLSTNDFTDAKKERLDNLNRYTDGGKTYESKFITIDGEPVLQVTEIV